MGLVYYLVKSFNKAILSIYFRKVYVIGAENIPQDGPVIMCGNHANQFIDPMMIMSHCEREVSFTIAASSFSKPVVGQVAQALKAIGVSRPEDSKKKGSGQLKFISPTEIKGEGTKFLEESNNMFKNGVSGLVITNKTVIIDKILDNETILIKENKEENPLPMDKSYDYFFLPKMDNSVLFKEVYKRLSNDGCICIFPEGTSHDRTEFIKLKAGIALMTLGAMSEHSSKPVKIVPVGLNYYKREEFRSEVVIEFGKPFEVPTEWADIYKVNKRDATEKLLKEIEARMKSVTLTAPSYQELRSLFLVRRLYVPSDAKLTPTQYNELCKRFSKGYEKLKDREETKVIMRRVNSYINELETTGINDHEVKNINFNYVWLVRKTFWSFVLFHVFLIICLPDIFILTPFAYLVQKKAEKERLLAKAKNPNKIEARDVVSSVKVVYSIIYMPFIFLIWSIFFYYSFNRYIFCELGSFSTLALGSVVFPFYLYTSALMLDYIFFCFQTMISRFVYFVTPKKILKLKHTREVLVKDVLEFVDAHIKETDPKYEEERILYKKETDSKYSEKEVMLRRNSMRKNKPYIQDEINSIIEEEKREN